MRDVARRLGANQVHNLGEDPARNAERGMACASCRQQTIDALFGVSRLPGPDRGSADAHAPRHYVHMDDVHIDNAQ